MRKFSNKEQSFIMRLVEGSKSLQSNIPINILKDLFYNRRIVFDAYNPKGALSFFRNDENFDPNEVFELHNDILELALLMHYLKQEGLIVEFSLREKREHYPSTDACGENVVACFTKEGLHRYYIECNDDVRDFLLHCLNNYVFVGQTLKDCVENDFKPFEERTLNEAKKQSFLAKLTFIASVVVPFVANLLFRQS